jgi:fatty acid desaturase
MVFIFLLDITGINFIFYFINKFFTGSRAINYDNSVQMEAIQRVGRSKIWIRYSAYAIIAALSVIYGFWHLILLYWFVPYITWFALTMRLRMIAEHFQVPSAAGYKSRTTVTNVIERFLFSPHNLSYHIEHHLYPSIPCYRLRKAHRLIKETSQYRENGHVTYGFVRLFSELIRKVD